MSSDKLEKFIIDKRNGFDDFEPAPGLFNSVETRKSRMISMNWNNRAEINYKVYVPKTCQLKLENKFGNIYMTDHQGKTEIALSNGDLKAFAFSNDAQLLTNYGDLSIGSVGISFQKFKLDAHYTDINLNFNPEAAFAIELEYIEKTNLTLPSGFEKEKEEVINEKDKVYKTIGKVGIGNKLPHVIIKIESGQVSISNY